MESSENILDEMRNEPCSRSKLPWTKEELNDLFLLVNEGFRTKLVIKYKDKWAFRNRTSTAIRVQMKKLREDPDFFKGTIPDEIQKKQNMRFLEEIQNRAIKYNMPPNVSLIQFTTYLRSLFPEYYSEIQK